MMQIVQERNSNTDSVDEAVALGISKLKCRTTALTLHL
jgi:hypothetical protein